MVGVGRSASILDQYYWMFPWFKMGHTAPASGAVDLQLLEVYFKMAMDHLDREHTTGGM